MRKKTTSKIPAAKAPARRAKPAPAKSAAAPVPAAPPTPAPKPASKPARPPSVDRLDHTHVRYPTTSTSDPKLTRELAIEAARLLADDKCEDIALLDVTGLSQMSDFIIIASGTSDRQMRSAASDLIDLAAKLGHTTFRQSVDDRATWVIVDFVDVIAHIFEPNTRAHYDLEMLWSDAPRLAWERPGKDTRDRTKAP